MKIFSSLSGNSLSFKSKGGGIVLQDTSNGNINIVPGTNGKFQVTGSTGFNLILDSTNQRLNVGTQNITSGGTNTYTFGDHNQNKGNFGSAMFGEYSYIDDNVGAAFAVGESVWVRAYGGKAWGRGTRVNNGGVFGFIGGMFLPGSTDPKTNNKVPQVGGNGAFGYYNTDSNQSDNHGVLAQGAVILGGLNHNIPSNSINSVILGGDRIKATSATTNTIFLPKLRIGLGQNAELVQNSLSNDVVVRNSLTGELELRSASSIGGGGGGSSAIYSGASPSTVTVGGLVSGSILTGRTIEQIIQEMLVPTLNPTLVNPSITSFTQNLASTQEVGVSVIPTFTTNFSRGSISPAYGTSGFRSGTPTKYVFSGNGNSRQVNTTSTSNNSAATGATTLAAGANTWSVYVAYGVGEQPKNSAGGNFGSPLASGATSVSQTTITGIHPYFYGKVASGGAPAGSNRPTANNALVTGGTKVVSSSTGTLNITFNATSDDYIWFAIPQTSADKTVWFVNALNNGTIGGSVSPGGNLFPNEDIVSVSTVLWAGVNYRVYISNYQSATSGAMEMRNS
jgi:hypothetical protein